MTDLRVVYRRYNARCNQHRFQELGEFVRPEIRVNDEPVGREQYASGLEAVIRAFPDYSWTIEHLLVEGEIVGVHLRDTGTHTGPWLGVDPTGQRVETQEFAFYRFLEGRIAEVWVTADNVEVLRQLRG